MARPALIVISGPAGAGKTTLAHALAAAAGCPAVCRDEIKEGMARASGGGYEPAPGDPLTEHASAVFFDVLRLLLESGVTVVGEAAFQDRAWRPNLEGLADLGRLRIVRCRVDPATGRRRVAGRPRRLAHTDTSLLADVGYHEAFVQVSLAVPTLDVDTSDGYRPSLDRIVTFATGG